METWNDIALNSSIVTKITKYKSYWSINWSLEILKTFYKTEQLPNNFILYMDNTCS